MYKIVIQSGIYKYFLVENYNNNMIKMNVIAPRLLVVSELDEDKGSVDNILNST